MICLFCISYFVIAIALLLEPASPPTITNEPQPQPDLLESLKRTPPENASYQDRTCYERVSNSISFSENLFGQEGDFSCIKTFGASLGGQVNDH